jgi:hypothetical protein
LISSPATKKEPVAYAAV